MRKALRQAGVAVSEMAEYLDVTRGSVSNWINGRVAPSVQTLRLWALRTGVPYEWLVTGEVGPAGPGGAAVRHQGLEPRTQCLSVFKSRKLEDARILSFTLSA